MNFKFLATLILIGLLYGGNSLAQDKQPVSSSNSEMDRTILPIQPPKRDAITELDARNVKTPELFEVKAPEGAPNIVVVLIDDIGFSATSTFGGRISTPTFDRLSNNGLRFNRFHTTALCSPSRASLLSGQSG